MAVFIITASESKPVIANLEKSLRAVAERVITIDPESYIRDYVDIQHIVKVIVVCEKLIELISKLDSGMVDKLFNVDSSKLVIIDDTNVDISDDYHLQKLLNDRSDIKKFDIYGIRYAAEEIQNIIIGNTEGCFTTRYSIHPNTVTHLLKTEIMILFGEEVEENITSVTVHFHEKKINAVKIQAKVWMFDVRDLPPGVKLFQIEVNEKTLGQNKLTIVDTKDVAEQAMMKLKTTDACGFLADVLCLNMHDLDLELTEILSGSSLQLIEKLLKYGDHQGFTYPTLLHLCAKHGLKETLKWCKSSNSCTDQFFAVDKMGKTAEQVAKEAFPDDSFYLDFKDKDSYKRGSQSNGRSSTGSVYYGLSKSTRQKRLPSDPGLPLTLPDPQPAYRFSNYTRAEHQYDEILDKDEASSNPYTDPWDKSELAGHIRKLSMKETHPDQQDNSTTKL
ncbi:hypothetical protein ACF0H5_001747 [Mactra antiquata]